MKPTVPCFLITTVVAFLVVYLGVLASEETHWEIHKPQDQPSTAASEAAIEGPAALGDCTAPQCGYVCKSKDVPLDQTCLTFKIELGGDIVQGPVYPTMDYTGPCYLNTWSNLAANFEADLTKCDRATGLLLFDEPYMQKSKGAKGDWNKMPYIVEQWKQFATKNKDLIL